MAISQLDLEFMEEVSKYFRSTKTVQNPDGSIRNTALYFKIDRNKVRKILVTTGDLISPITEEAVRLRKEGKSIKDIAIYFGVSETIVSTSLPYESKFDNTKNPSKHAFEVREYRAYEKKQMKRQLELRSMDNQVPNSSSDGILNANNKEWQKDIKMSYTEAYHRPHRNTWSELEEMESNLYDMLSDEEKNVFIQYKKEYDKIKTQKEKEEQEFDELRNKATLSKKEKQKLEKYLMDFGYFPGALNSRNVKVLEEIAGNELPPEPYSVVRLHMELYQDYPDNHITETLRKYGSLIYGENISRDVIVPSDIPLYALHYVIQKSFGWENSHLRMFELPEERFNDICCNGSLWSSLVGIIFRSPLMYEDDEFWADDYNGGSFKNWLRKKYTGPYMSQCHGEGIISCHEDMMTLDMEEEHYLVYAMSYNQSADNYDGEEYLYGVYPVYDYNGKICSEPKPWKKDIPYRIETVKFKDIPAEGLKHLFEHSPAALLERLPISSVLAIGCDKLPELCTAEERKHIDEQIIQTGEEIFNSVKGVVDRLISDEIDSPDAQPIAGPITDVLLYNYDFGDNWKIKITLSENCSDLVNSGRITQNELDRANVKCREVYRPVLIARDGEMLVDDVGGLYGFVEFLEAINPDYTRMTLEEKEEAKHNKKDMLEWAKGLGWHKEKVKDFNLL